jgi:hypothetical protein
MMIPLKALLCLLLGDLFRISTFSVLASGRELQQGREPDFTFGFWNSIVTCANPDAQPRLTFNKVMRCGCAKDGSYTGPCLDDGLEVLGLDKKAVVQMDNELSKPSPPLSTGDTCQQLPQVFIDSGTGDSGASFDELWDAAMNSPCATDPNLEWMGRDCRDSFIPGMGAEGFTGTQDRSDPNKPCTLECATLYLKIAELCPRVYQLLRLNELAPICPELRSVQIQPLPGAPVPIDGSYVAPQAPVVTPEAPVVTPEAPVVTPETPVVTPEIPAAAPLATVPEPEPVIIAPEAAIPPVVVPLAAPVTVPELVPEVNPPQSAQAAEFVTPAPAPSAPSASVITTCGVAFLVSFLTHCTLHT